MAEIDTSSYLKPATLPVQKGPLDIAQQLGGLQVQQQQIQQNAIGIDQSKLKLANDRFQIVNKLLTTLANKPDLKAEDIVNESNNALKMGLSSPQQHSQFVSEIPSKTAVQRQYPNATPQQIDQIYSNVLRQHIDQRVAKAQNIMDAVNTMYGAPGATDTGQVIQPTRQGLRGPPVAVGAPIQKQLGPSTEVATPGGTQQLGPQPPQLPAGAMPVEGGIPGQYQTPPTAPKALPTGPINNPAILGQSSNFGGKVLGATVEAPTIPQQNIDSRFPSGIVPRGPMTSQPPLFEEGKKALSSDQDLATQKLTAIKPALQALPLISQLNFSGPLTGKITEIGATLKNLGIIPTDTKNDKVAVTQEVMKKLAQYVSSNPVGQRSDAAQTLAEAGSPNPKVQILPALMKLTKDAIILDRVQAARPGAFEGNDYSKYGQHRSTFPPSIDERAFGLDLMEPKERQALISEMQKKKDTFEGKKFWKSLAIVDKQGLIDTGDGQ